MLKNICCVPGRIEQAPELTAAIPPRDMAYLTNPEYNGSLYWLHSEDESQMATWIGSNFVITSLGEITLSYLTKSKNENRETYEIDPNSCKSAMYGNFLVNTYPADSRPGVQKTETRILKIPKNREMEIDLIFRFCTDAEVTQFVKYCKHNFAKEFAFPGPESREDYKRVCDEVERARIYNNQAAMNAVELEETSTSQNSQPPIQLGNINEMPTARVQDTQPTTSQPSASQPSTSQP